MAFWGDGTERDTRMKQLVRSALGIQGSDAFVRSRDCKSKAGGGQFRKEGVRKCQGGGQRARQM